MSGAGMANAKSMTKKLNNNASQSCGVCKLWKSLADSNWNKFMVSKQPMHLSISTRLNEKDCYLEDYSRRKLETTIPHSNGRICVGVTCGYLIFFGRKTRDFWLVNPFTRKHLRFRGFPFAVSPYPRHTRGILVFSPSMSGWVFVVSTSEFGTPIAFSLAGKEARWHYVKSALCSCDLHFFMGKIYMLDMINRLYELKINPEPTLTLLQMKNSPWSQASFRNLEFVSSGENLYVMNALQDAFEAYEVDFSEMKWVSSERTIGKFAVFLSEVKCDAAIKAETWAHPWTRYKKLNYSDGYEQCKENLRCLTTNMWYFPYDCLKLNDDNSDMKTGALVNILEE